MLHWCPLPPPPPFPSPAPLAALCESPEDRKGVLTGRALAGTFTETELGEIKFPTISAPVLEKICQYFYHKIRHSGSPEPAPEFPIEPEMALELLMAANYLDV